MAIDANCGYARNATFIRRSLGLTDLFGAFVPCEEDFYFCAIQPCLNGDIRQHQSVADIPTVCEITCPLHALLFCEPDQAGRIQRIGSPLRAFMMELQAGLSPGLRDPRIEALRIFPRAEFCRAILATVPTLFWHVGIKFERFPSNRDNEILSKDLDRSVELPLCDIAPRADRIRDYFDLKHGLRAERAHLRRNGYTRRGTTIDATSRAFEFAHLILLEKACARGRHLVFTTQVVTLV